MQREDYMLRMIAQMGRAFFAEVIYLEWRRQVAMGMPQAESCARRALLLYALAYDGIVMDRETGQRIAELEGDIEPRELNVDASIT